MTKSAHIEAGGRSVTVSSATSGVADWSIRYFGDWWSATSSDRPVELLVSANVSPFDAPGQVEFVHMLATDSVEYAGEPMEYVRDEEGVVRAAQGLTSYRYTPGRSLQIVGAQETEVAAAAARLAREMLRGRLLGDGWLILHASAAVGPDGQTVLALGDKGAGKTTTAFSLAQCPGWSLLANDRVFVRPDNDGGVEVLPWPSAAAIGFGLLEASNWYESVASRVRRGEQMHPTQKQAVTDALIAGDRTPLRKPNGHELKPQFWPDQLRDWLGLPLATRGTATNVLFPTVRPNSHPGTLSGVRDVGASDMFTAEQDDRYPDVFGICPDSLASCDEVLKRLNMLEKASVLLGHDVRANRAFLTDLIERP
ncbi:hypothetical protein GCM10022221_67270 [Actinocorallia aurea]